MTIHTIPFAADRALVDFGNTTTTRESESFRAGLRAAIDLDDGIPQELTPEAFGSVSGPARTVSPGAEVVCNCATTDRGRLVIEESDGSGEWSEGAAFTLLGGSSVGLKFTTTAPLYRLRFEAMPGASVKRVVVRSEPRTA